MEANFKAAPRSSPEPLVALAKRSHLGSPRRCRRAINHMQDARTLVVEQSTPPRAEKYRRGIVVPCEAAGRAPVYMIDPTCWPRSAAVSRPGTSPFTTCTRSMWRAFAIEERAIQWQRALMLRKFGGAHLPEQLCLLVSRDGDIRWYV